MPSSSLSLSLNLPPLGAVLPSGSTWWYAADKESTPSGGIISSLTDFSGNSRTLTATGSPILSSVSGFPCIILDGIDDRFDSANDTVPINTFSQYTIGVVSTCENDFSFTDPPSNCLVYFPEFGGWGTVYVAPFQRFVNTRYGSSQSGNLPSYARPSTLGTEAITSTIWTKNETVEYLYVNGVLVATYTGKLSSIASTSNTLRIGFTNPTNSFYKGRLLEAVGYAGIGDNAIQLGQYFNNKYGLA